MHIDLPQGGLEIPCKLIFCGDAGVIIEVRRLLEEALSSGLLSTPTLDKEPAQNVIPEQPKEKK